jgi:hypothetical protein
MYGLRLFIGLIIDTDPAFALMVQHIALPYDQAA